MRFFFSFMAKTLIEDDVGIVFATDAAALKHAETIAVECVKNGVLDGCSVIVTRGGKVLFDVPMNAPMH